MGISTQALFGQLLIGLINGSFYALLSLGLAVIFGLLNIINFAHGAQYMLGAFCAWFLLSEWQLGYWWALLIVPPVVALTGIVIERLMLRHLYKLDHLYGLLLTFGLALIIQGLFRNAFGSSGLPYAMPQQLTGGHNLGFMFLPTYRAWVIVASLTVCLGTCGGDRGNGVLRAGRGAGHSPLALRRCLASRAAVRNAIRQPRGRCRGARGYNRPLEPIQNGKSR